MTEIIMQQPPLTTEAFRVLSIDGGGIKGVYTAHLLAAIEEQRGQGKGIGEYFDMICGTSTGAIIAAGIAAGKTARQIADEYDRFGPIIFPPENLWGLMVRNIRALFCSSKYDNKPLIETLESITDGKRFSESNNYLCIPVTVANSSHPRIYRTRHSAKHSWDDCKIADIAVASAAAPTFFPMVESPVSSTTHYADGGLFANDPALIGLTEALKIFVGEESERNLFSCVDILSVGSFPAPSVFRPQKGLNKLTDKEASRIRNQWRNKSVFGWMNIFPSGPPLVSLVLDVQSAHTRWIVGDLKKFIPHFRTYCRRDAANAKVGSTPIDEMTKMSIDDACPIAMKTMADRGKVDGLVAASEPEIMSFFKNPIQPIQLIQNQTSK